VSGSANYTDGVKLDFRVQAVIGYRYSATAGSMAGIMLGPVDSMSFSTSSDWSGIQTITIPSGTVSSFPPSQTTTFPPVTPDDSQPYSPDQMYAPSQTYTPDQVYTSDFMFIKPLDALVVGVLLGGVVIVVVLVFLRRHIKTSTDTNDSLCQTSGVSSRNVIK
jgi:hypothetical protein